MATKKNKGYVAEAEENAVEETIYTAPETEAVETEADKAEKFKLQKKEAAKRFKEKKKKEAEERLANYNKFLASIKASGTYDKFTDEEKQLLESFTKPVTKTSNNTSGLFVTLFPNAKVGDSITLMEAFQRSMQGKPKIDSYVKKWVDKGIVIKYTANQENVMNSTYTIEALPPNA